MSDIQLQAEITDLMRKLKSVGNHGRKAAKEAFTDASGILIAAIQGRAPISDAPHHRYSTPKIGNRSRAPRGMGKKVATYMPGNLKRSFKVLPFRRSSAVWIGPKVAKGNPSGVFSGLRTDAYYAAMVEFGTRRTSAQPFVRPAVAAGGSTTLRIATVALKKKLEQFTKSISTA